LVILILMNLYDCCMYFDEDLVLDFRLNILKDHVNNFVIAEATKDHTGKDKKLNFNINNFSKFKDRITYLIVDDLPMNIRSFKKNWPVHHLRDQHQRNALARGYKNCNDDDLIMISDIDEIPNPNKIKEFKINNKYACFMQKNFQSKINLLNVSDKYWMGTKIIQKKNLKSPQWLRSIKTSKTAFWKFYKPRQPQLIYDGGWHFSFLKKPSGISKKILTGLQFLLFKKGPLAVGASYVCGFIISDPYLETPNLQFHVSPASMDFIGKTTLHNFPAFTPTITNLRPTSRGSIEIKSPDTRIAPKIQMNYLSTNEDKEMAGKAIKITRNIVMNSKAFKKYEPEELRPGIHITDNMTISKEAGKYANTIFHPVSTCKMGNDDQAVVNDKLIVHGLKNLRIVDASIMPHITSGNTNAPTIMIAEKAADMIIADAKS